MNIDTCYAEDIYVGYRYFETFEKPCLYPLASASSYTRFQSRADGVKFADNTLTLQVEVENIGETAGKDVVQVYLSQPAGALEKVKKQLIDFGKTRELPPGARQRLEFAVPALRFASYDEKRQAYLLEQGQYQIHVGSSVRDTICCGSFTLAEDLVLKQVKNRFAAREDLPLLTQEKPEISGRLTQIKAEPGKSNTFEKNPPCRQEYRSEPEILYSDVCQNEDLLWDFVRQMTDYELGRMNICSDAGWTMDGRGEAGRVYLLENYQMNVPFIVADGNNGVNLKAKNVGMPVSSVVCASFNRELAYAAARAIAEEALELGVSIILAPGMNIHRNPLCGRNAEYFSEDPVLTGVMAGMYIKGLEEQGVQTSIKHFLANNCETARKRSNSLVSERAIREVYLKAFEIAFEIHQPSTVMTAYNLVNGIYPAENEVLLQEVLREEFHFEGFVMTDWNSYDTIDIVRAVQAGTSWITPGSADDTYVKVILDGLASGKISRRRLEENIYYLLKVMIKHQRGK